MHARKMEFFVLFETSILSFHSFENVHSKWLKKEHGIIFKYIKLCNLDGYKIFYIASVFKF